MNFLDSVRRNIAQGRVSPTLIAGVTIILCIVLYSVIGPENAPVVAWSPQCRSSPGEDSAWARASRCGGAVSAITRAAIWRN